MRKYLSELLSWPIFTWQNDLVIHPLAETSRLQGRFLGRVLDLGFDLSEASLAVLTEDVLDTSAIEGESLDRESVRSSVARRLGIDTGISRPQDRRVEGIVTVLMDVTAWLLWYLGCLQRAIASSETLLAALLQKARLWQKLSGVPLNPRQTTMLNRFFSDWEGNITARKWSQMTQVSQDTALRDLQEMIVLGVLRQNPGGGRAVSYSLVFPE